MTRLSAGLLTLLAFAGMALPSLRIASDDTQVPDKNDCRCQDPIKAYSTPAEEKDLCSKGNTNGTCSLKWNLPAGGHRAAFDGAIKQLGSRAPKATPTPEFTGLCVGRPGSGSWCPWIEFMRRDDGYEKSPETAGLGFLALVSASFEMGPPEERNRAAMVLNEAESAQALGLTLAKGGNWSAIRPGQYELRANYGCLMAVAVPSRLQTIVIQNSRSRTEGSCAQ